LIAAIRDTAAGALQLVGLTALRLRIELAYEEGPPEAAQLIAVMTDALKMWCYNHGWRSWRELQVPLDDGRDTGRLDLVIVHPGKPDVVIELDSKSVPRSVAKLELARDRGAIPVWLRWGQGRVIAPHGVTAIDLTG
jgi:hypothetical protein